MTETVSMESEEKVPLDYKTYKVGDNILLKKSPDEKGTFYTVKAADPVPDIEKQDTTNWLLTSGSEYNAGDINDWVEPETNTLYMLPTSVICDRNIELRVFMPASDQLFGVKNDPDVVITPEVSPWKKPRITLKAWGTTYLPNFKLKNPSEYTIMMCKIAMTTGRKYQLLELKTAPLTYDTVVLSGIKP